MKLRYPLILLAFLFLAPFQMEAQRMEGMASFYADRFDGKPTSTGETFRQDGFMAASMEFDYGTVLEVTNLANGKTVEVRINDCGPHAKNRVIDLSRAAAERLDFIKDGEAKVKLKVIVPSEAGPTCSRGAWSKKLKAAGKKPKAPPVVPPLNQGQSAAAPNPATVVPAAGTAALEGLASYYADRYHGRPTSTGETYDKNALTAASKSFPYGTILEVTNPVNGRTVQVRVNDCGPSTEARIIDLSRAASDRIDLTRAGVSMVTLRVVSMGNDGPTCNRAAWIRELQAKGTEPEPAPEEEEFIALPIGDPGVAPPPPTVPPATTAPAAAPGPPPPPPAPVAAEVPTTYGTAPPAAIPEQEFDDTDVLFGVQVAAFSKAVNAEKLKDELKEKGFAYVWSAKVGDVYRVFTGKFYFQNQAEDYKIKVREAGYNGATTRRIQ
jgi:rare lipoprotein A (peptidoglycan hydrolase)